MSLTNVIVLLEAGKHELTLLKTVEAEEKEFVTTCFVLSVSRHIDNVIREIAQLT